jgi:hypothetical protein
VSGEPGEIGAIFRPVGADGAVGFLDEAATLQGKGYCGFRDTQTGRKLLLFQHQFKISVY